ncbi:hypothetical protein COV61_05165 [Candidatus Micrarchaeota archaeon CG11_big_fil_rev_8_21_14_0_20_47_5]|nr:MAG: hypothetical protein AUJ17_05090 [Candidatus Micrarchaeota archaeon CG1_02_47_40]PIN82716.1 MAG: hypothetical protein COV61_05165 [Candidatus Micrarchaeota archaeon CG11_big_fil_rev_8_21_14_0_20_47_5]
MAKILLNNKRIIAKDALIAKTFLQKMRGLMFRRKAVPIWFEFLWERRWAIHSFFVPFPFDAVFVDAEGRVVDAAERIMPFTMRITPKKSCKFLLELPAGSVGKFKIRKGDNISVLL